DEPQLDVLELAQQVSQRAHRAAVGEVAYHRHADAVDLADLGTDRVEVQQRLSRMLARTVARVDDRHRAHRRGAAGRAPLALTQHEAVAGSAADADRDL